MLIKPLSFCLLALNLVGCATTEIIESPKTAFVAQNTEVPPPKVIWTSRTLKEKFDYLGQIKVRSWTYDGALARLTNAGQEMKADAVIDVHYEAVGFFATMSAFAVKFKN